MRSDEWAEQTSEEARSEAAMWTRGATGSGAGRRPPALLARRGPTWDADEVAAHLMSCRRQMVTGLRRRTPWAGLDAETLDSCFGHGAAVIVRVAASGQRPEWRSPKDLEKAQIAAFRHQALDHWKRVNARSREGDRFAVAFDPDRHGAQDAPMDRLFEQPDLHVIHRELLLELPDGPLRAFWQPVLAESVNFKDAGDRIGWTKAEVMAGTRAGRSAFSAYFDRRESGELCRERGRDVLAARKGTADAATTERAEAHLEACYACSLVHGAQGGALERGILGVAPVGLLLRLAIRAGDIASVPAARWTEAGAGGRLITGGLAALTVAGAGVGIEAAVDKAPTPAAVPTAAPRSAPATVAREAFRTPALVVARTAPARPARADAGGTTSKRRSQPSKTTTGTSGSGRAAPGPGPAASEFSFEHAASAAATATPASRTAAPPTPAATEFEGP